VEPVAWLWIPLTVGAALAQTARNATQRHLTAAVGTLGATLVRFLYGLPFALLWLLVVSAGVEWRLPPPGGGFLAWTFIGAMAQVAATALLLLTMHERNFALAVAYSKTEILQVALFAVALLGDPLKLPAALAIASGTLGVLLLSPVGEGNPLRALATGWTWRSARLGLACGALFALSAVAYRGAALTLPGVPFLLVGAYLLAGAQLIQTLALGGWLLLRKPVVIASVLRAWRVSLFAGLMGATASACWQTAFTIEPVAHVRTLGLIELVFSYAVSRRFNREPHSGQELLGMILLALGVALIALAR
jgi:drug/metabolite transporter (DMT)-like permease